MREVLNTLHSFSLLLESSPGSNRTLIVMQNNAFFHLLSTSHFGTGTSGGNTQRAEQTRTTQSAGNKHGAQQ